MLVYTRGNLIPGPLRDERFIYKGKPSAAALKKYWRLLPDGSPDPDCKPFAVKEHIELYHRAYSEMDAYQIITRPPGPVPQYADRTEYHREYWRNKRSKH